MESLYVCLFSNGHIKVGRSIDPKSRVAVHADRVACLGISLADHCVVWCSGSALRAETALIGRCTEAATQRNKNEWFTGLNYDEVCRWAADCAESAPPAHLDTYINEESPDWRNVVRVLKLAGYTQIQLAACCGCSQASISDLANGVTKDPTWAIGDALIQLAKAAQSSLEGADPLVSVSLNRHALKHEQASPATPLN